MSMKYPCIVYTKGVHENSLTISSDVCKKWCHIDCKTTISFDNYMQLKANHSDFIWLWDLSKHKKENTATT